MTGENSRLGLLEFGKGCRHATFNRYSPRTVHVAHIVERHGEEIVLGKGGPLKEYGGASGFTVRTKRFRNLYYQFFFKCYPIFPPFKVEVTGINHF